MLVSLYVILCQIILCLLVKYIMFEDAEGEGGLARPQRGHANSNSNSDSNSNSMIVIEIVIV